MTRRFANLLSELPAELLQNLDEAYRAYGVENIRELLISGPAKPAVCDFRSVPRHRWQDGVMQQIIPENASVLDLGCGSGELLGTLMQKKKVRGQGVEMAFDAVLECIAGKIPVFQADLDEGLNGFPDDSFDFVILEETVQMLHKPLKTLQEMLRVGRHGIISFPNFGCWNVRLALALKGRMPVTEELPYSWYDTPNIHLLSLADFYSWAEDHHVRIAAGYTFMNNCVRKMEYPQDNLLAEEVLLRIEKQ